MNHEHARRNRRTDRSRRREVARSIVSLAACCGLATLSGCLTGMSGIDKRTIDLLEKRTQDLQANLRPSPQAAPEFDSNGIRDRRPESTNPTASELEFTQADEDRAVAERLESFGDGSEGDIEPLVLGYEDVLRYAQLNSREYRTAEESYILAALNLIIQRHLFSPRFFNDTSVDLTSAGEDGRFSSAVSVLNNLRATQQLPLGGSISAQWLYSLTQQLRDEASGEYVQSSSIVLSGNVPLLRGAGLVASEGLIQAERNLVYAARSFERFRRTFLVSISQEYFSLLETQSSIDNQSNRLDRQNFLLERTLANVAAGRLAAFEEALVRNQLRSTEASLENARESYRLQLERFRIRLALPPTQPIDLLPLTVDLPEPDISPGEAAVRALDYRLDLQNNRDQLDDDRRAVKNAENNVLPDFDLAGSVTLPTDRDEQVGGLGFDVDDTTFNVGVDFSLPLDRRIERTNLRQAQISLARAQRDYEAFRDNVIVDARQAVRSVELARFQLELAEERVEINRQRLEEQRLKIDEIVPQTLLDTENDLIEAETDRDSAQTDLRIAVLNYLLDTGQMRVAEDGAIEAPGGIDLEAIRDQARRDAEAAQEAPADPADPAGP